MVHGRGTLRLYHYRARVDEVYRTPILLVMSLISKPYILDLAPGQSLVEFLLDRGFDVYMVDWGTPRPEDKRLRLEDYVLDFIPECVEAVHERSGEPDVSMVGYCMGGLLAALYAALHPDAASGGRLSNLACFTTPVNYDGMGLFRIWTDPGPLRCRPDRRQAGQRPAADALRLVQRAAADLPGRRAGAPLRGRGRLHGMLRARYDSGSETVP